jgi:hypothetical protein
MSLTISNVLFVAHRLGVLYWQLKRLVQIYHILFLPRYKIYFDLDLNEYILWLNIRNVLDISSIKPICELNYFPLHYSVFAREQFFYMYLRLKFVFSQ